MKTESIESGVHDGYKAFVGCICDKCAEWRRSPANLIKPRNIAQSIRRSSAPYQAAITSFIRREIIRSDDGQSDKKIFHFEDGSFLTFMVSYAAIDDGSM